MGRSLFLFPPPFTNATTTTSSSTPTAASRDVASPSVSQKPAGLVPVA